LWQRINEVKPVIILPRDDADYIKYENYYLFNFCLKSWEFQLDRFYVKDFNSVEKERHFNVVDLDSDYNPDVINPIYQLFVSGFLYSEGFMLLIEDLYGVHDFYDELNLFREKLFADDFIGDFFEDIQFNTSVYGFVFGGFWVDVRERCRLILDKADLFEDIDCRGPMKFSGFLYPDDFISYKSNPYWSRFGEFVSMDEWVALKERTFSCYKDAVFNFDLAKVSR